MRSGDPNSMPPRHSEHDPQIRARRRYHIGVPGAVYIFVTLLVALGAFNSQNNLLFWAFGFALSLLIVSGVISGAMLMGVELVREAPVPVTEGEAGVIHYRVRNRNRIVPAFALTIAEVRLPVPSGRLGRHARRHSNPGDPSRATPALAFVPHVPPGKTISAPGLLKAHRRGVEELEGMLVSTSFPFGIIKKSLLFEQPDEVLVRPRLRPLPHGFVNSAIRSGDHGMTPTRRAGHGDEFFSLREYQAGDGLRAIAWRASARRGELLVKQTAAPAPLRMHVVLSFANSPGAAADEEAVRLAASAVDAALARSLAVGLSVLGSGLEIRPRDGRLQRELVLDALARLSADEARAGLPLGKTHRDADARALRPPGVVVVVHAGPVDQSDAPPWAVHLGVERAHPEREPEPAEVGA